MSLHDAAYWMEVHARMRQGDARARGEICSLLPLITRLLGQNHPHDQDEAAESAEDALLVYLSEPEQFDPCRGCSLVTWLTIQARGHLSHRLRAKQNHERHEIAAGAMERELEKILSEKGRETAIYRGRDKEGFEEDRQRLDDLLGMLKSCECDEVALLRYGASHGEWVQQLHLEHLPAEEQHHKINREKERLKKKLRRWAQQMQGGVEYGFTRETISHRST